ncbi:MAG TPA: DUF3300 domain-containing protein [Usitatibacter sp.]|nr:DUF3300 domain-containing protein [Usitatibacter sp.]
MSTMLGRLMRAFLAMVMMAVAPGVAIAQPTQAELDQLLAPVALYPDALLGNVLAASTYPLEVVELQRWLERNPGLSPQEVEQAVESQPWDPSVRALAPFREVVAMMNGELDWMQRVGNAFLADEGAVMDSVQRLRQRARDVGALQDNERERVVVEREYIAIEPIRPEILYVPVYDPRVVYGGWWWPDYPPYVWNTFYFGPWDYVVGGIAFGAGINVWRNWHAHHPHPDWRHRNLIVRRPGAPAVWRHDPGHRIGVPYADSRTSRIYRPQDRDRDRVRDRRDFRGFDVRPGVSRPVPAPVERAPAQVARPQAAPLQRNEIARPMPSPAPVPRSQIARPMPSPGAPAQQSRAMPVQPRSMPSQQSRAMPVQPRSMPSQQPHALQPMPNAIARQQSERGHQSLAAQPGNPIARASRDKR